MKLLNLLFYPLIFCACTIKKIVTKQNNFILKNETQQVLAFPTAEGFGKYTFGGRNGKVIIVSNLNDNGIGSFRFAAEQKYSRFIVFAISGTIHLKSKVNIKGDVTIAGQTAPGDGICLADNTVSLNGNNIIVRYLRFRLGDKYQNLGKVDRSGDDDAFGGNKFKNIIIDHCSMSWSDDEVFSIYNGDSTTLQWNLISEPLNYSYHFETGDSDFEQHGYGAIWGGIHLTAHHNLFAHCNSRTPRFNGNRQGILEMVDFRNNVIYNWGHNNVYAGEGGNYNIVNNYYKYGPNTINNVKNRIVNPWKKEPTIPFGKFYVNGNYVDEFEEVTSDNWKGVHLENGTNEEKEKMKLATELNYLNVNTQSAIIAYNNILKLVGCTIPTRDTLDERIINDVKKRTGKIIDVQGGYTHGTAYELTTNAWPFLATKPPLKDADNDGMPDEWELKNKLNPNDATDATKNTLQKEYNNLEVYINEISK